MGKFLEDRDFSMKSNVAAGNHGSMHFLECQGHVWLKPWLLANIPTSSGEFWYPSHPFFNENPKNAVDPEKNLPLLNHQIWGGTHGYPTPGQTAAENGISELQHSSSVPSPWRWRAAPKTPDTKAKNWWMCSFYSLPILNSPINGQKMICGNPWKSPTKNPWLSGCLRLGGRDCTQKLMAVIKSYSLLLGIRSTIPCLGHLIIQGSNLHRGSIIQGSFRDLTDWCNLSKILFFTILPFFQVADNLTTWNLFKFRTCWQDMTVERNRSPLVHLFLQLHAGFPSHGGTPKSSKSAYNKRKPIGLWGTHTPPMYHGITKK